MPAPCFCCDPAGDVQYPCLDNLVFETGSPGGGIADGRINAYDLAAPVVLYGIDYGNGQRGLHVYAADGSGLLFQVSAEQIAAMPECPESNTLIARDIARGISLYRLSRDSRRVCPFQLNAFAERAGRMYVVIFGTLSAGSPYQSWEE